MNSRTRGRITVNSPPPHESTSSPARSIASQRGSEDRTMSSAHSTSTSKQCLKRADKVRARLLWHLVENVRFHGGHRRRQRLRAYSSAAGRARQDVLQSMLQ